MSDYHSIESLKSGNKKEKKLQVKAHKPAILESAYYIASLLNCFIPKTVQAVANQAGAWYRGYRSTHDHPPWGDLVRMMKIRFGKSEKGGAYEEMKRLSQTNREYMHQFELIQSRLQVELPYLPESHYITPFVSGLREDIKHLVLAKHPTDHLSQLHLWQYPLLLRSES